MEKVSYSRLAKIPQRQDGAGRDRRLSYSGPLKWSFKKYLLHVPLPRFLALVVVGHRRCGLVAGPRYEAPARCSASATSSPSFLRALSFEL